jgi:exopolyphosphatase/guanosine-5'-triphosphate,3'-diphosphate pyrophosphatase
MMAAKGQGDAPVAGYKVSHAEVRHLLDRLREMSLRARRGMAGMTPDRADIIVAGLTIVDALMKRFHVNTLAIHTRGVRDGLLREMIEETAVGGEGDDDAHREAAIERLECAARLQDVGYVINYDQHHKHSYHLIRNSRLPGLRPHDVELIANVARYHRGAHPKRKHENLARLSSDDQRRVQRMAAILRMAGGLDRSRSQQVRDVVASVDDGRLVLAVAADQEPQVDIWGAERRTDLFEKVFGMKVDVRWAGAAAIAGG